MDDLIHGRTNYSNSFSSSLALKNTTELDNLLDINKPNIAKSKRKPQKSQNKKRTMIQIEKKIARSTKQDFLRFALVEQKY